MNFQPKSHLFANTEGVGYSNRSTTKLQAGLTYQAVTARTNLAHDATVTKIALDLNGEEIVQISGADLRAIEAYRDTFNEAGVFTLDFTRFDFKTVFGMRWKELITLPGDQVTLVVEFGTKHASDPANIEMSVEALVTDTKSAPVFIPKLHRFIKNIAGSGLQELIYPNSQPNRMIQSMMFDETDVQITKLEIFRNDRRIYEANRAKLEYDQQRYGKRKPQSGKLFFEPTMFGLGQQNAMSSGLPDSLIFKLTTSAAGQLPVVVEGYEQIGELPKAG